jgi:hypothetical protein
VSRRVGMVMRYTLTSRGRGALLFLLGSFQTRSPLVNAPGADVMLGGGTPGSDMTHPQVVSPSGFVACPPGQAVSHAMDRRA